MTSIMLNCRSSSSAEIWSYTLNIHSTAFGIEQWDKNSSALRLHVESVSAARNVCTSSGASGIRFSNSRYIE